MIGQALVIVALSTALYMLMALGFTLVFGVMRIVNFAHGEFVMLGAYALFVIQMTAGWPYFAALPAAALTAGLIGIVFERLLFRRFVGDELGAMIVSLGLAIALQGAVRAVFGVDSLAVERPVSGAFEVAGVLLPCDQTVVAVIAVALIGGVYLLLKHTRLGLALRAVAQDPVVARLQGVAPWRYYTIAFALSTALAGFAGALIAPVYEIQPYMGDHALMRAFIVVVRGGLGSLPGALLASLVLGIIDTSVALWIDATAALLASFVVVIGLLVLRPNGLMGRA